MSSRCHVPAGSTAAKQPRPECVPARERLQGHPAARDQVPPACSGTVGLHGSSRPTDGATMCNRSGGPARLVHALRPDVAGVNHAGRRSSFKGSLWRKRWRNTARPKPSTPTRAARSREATSSRCGPTARSRSAWMARAHEGTTSLSSATGGAAGTSRSTCGSMPACPRPGAETDRHPTFCDGRSPLSSIDGKSPDRARFNQPKHDAVAPFPRRMATRKPPGTSSGQLCHLST